MPFGQFLLMCLVIFILVELLAFSNVWNEYLPFGSILIPITAFKHLPTPLPLIKHMVQLFPALDQHCTTSQSTVAEEEFFPQLNFVSLQEAI